MCEWRARIPARSDVVIHELENMNDSIVVDFFFVGGFTLPFISGVYVGFISTP